MLRSRTSKLVILTAWLIGTSCYASDFDKLPANPQPSLQHKISDEINDFFVDFTRLQAQNPGGIEEMRNQWSQPTRSDFAISHAAMIDTYKADPDKEKFQQYWRKSGTGTIHHKVESDMPIIQRVRAGVQFDVDFTTLFGMPTAEPKAKAVAGSSSHIRYRLAVKSVEIGNNHQLAANAASDHLKEDELNYAGKAEIEYKLEPYNIHEAANAGVAPAAFPNQSSDEGFASKIPSAKFHTRVEPSTAPETWGEKENQPGARISMTQEEGFYKLTHVTKSNLLEEDTTEHDFSAPVYGETKVGRKFDASWKVVESSARNVFNSKSGPHVDFTYNHQENIYGSQVNYSKDAHNVRFEAQFRQGFEPGHDRVGREGDKYTVGYEFNF